MELHFSQNTITNSSVLTPSNFRWLDEVRSFYEHCLKCRNINDCPSNFGTARRPAIGIENGMVIEVVVECSKRRELIAAERLNKIAFNKRHLGKPLEYLDYDQYSEKSIEKLRKWISEYKIGVTTNGIMLIGCVGDGKTQLAVSILEDLIFKGETGDIVDFVDVIRNYREQRYDIVNSYKARLLVVDDCLPANMSEFVTDILFELVNYRYKINCPTIFTANASIGTDGIRQLNGTPIDERIRSRLREMTQIIYLGGSDRRGKN